MSDIDNIGDFYPELTHEPVVETTLEQPQIEEYTLTRDIKNVGRAVLSFIKRLPLGH